MADDPVFSSHDGLIARDSGPWAEDKLHYLERYQNIFTSGMRLQWDRLVYVDLMAGPGRCVVTDSGREFAGSPIRALRTKYPFDQVICIESDMSMHDALSIRIAEEPRCASALVIPSDHNETKVIADVRSSTKGALTLAFVDLVGQEVAYETIAALTRERQIDLLFSFPEMDLLRNSTIVVPGSAEGQRWNRFFGTDEWVACLHGSGANVMVRLRALYMKQLERLGYESTMVRLPMLNSKGRALYRPLFASKHARGIDFFKKAALVEPSPQPRLF